MRDWQFEVVTLVVRYDPAKSDPPAGWNWTSLLDDEAAVVSTREADIFDLDPFRETWYAAKEECERQEQIAATIVADAAKDEPAMFPGSEGTTWGEALGVDEGPAFYAPEEAGDVREADD